MTTVAVDATGTVAADTQLTSANYVVRACKVFRMPDGGVITGSGNWALIYARIQWHIEGESGDPPDIRGGELVIVKPGGAIWLAEGDSPAYPILDRTVAIGCGRDLARAALARGLSAREALEEALPLDLYSSGPIQTMTVCQPPPEFPGVVTHAPKRRRA